MNSSFYIADFSSAEISHDKSFDYSRHGYAKYFCPRLCGKVLLFLTIFTQSPSAFADFLPDLYRPVQSPLIPIRPVIIFPFEPFFDEVGHYIAPNETIPGVSRKILSMAPAGVLISVGTERGFIGSSLAPHISHLLLADSDPRIVRFNRINIALLKLARDHQDYLQLRLSSDSSNWQTRVQVDPSIDSESRSILIDSSFHKWFKEAHELPSFNCFLLKPGEDSKNRWAFEGANYLHDETLFNRIQYLAKSDKIQSILLDFGNSAEVNTLLLALRKARLIVSVLDLSNAWQEPFLGIERLKTLIEQVQERTRPDSILLLTNQMALIGANNETEGNTLVLGYIGATFENIRAESQNLNEFSNYLYESESHARGPNPPDPKVTDITEAAQMNPHIQLP